MRPRLTVLTLTVADLAAAAAAGGRVVTRLREVPRRLRRSFRRP